MLTGILMPAVTAMAMIVANPIDQRGQLHARQCTR
jgi:hypothetical protein